MSRKLEAIINKSKEVSPDLWAKKSLAEARKWIKSKVIGQ